MDFEGDSLKFYVGEPVDSILSFKLGNNESIYLITASHLNCTISLWEWDCAHTKAPNRVQSQQLPSVNYIEVLSAADARFVVASQEGLYLFEINMDQKLEQIVGPVGSGNVLSLDVLRNGKQLLTAGEDGYMRFYSTSDLSLIRTVSIYSSLLAIFSCLFLIDFNCIYELGGSATGVQVARFATDTLVYSVSSKVIEVWDLQRSTTQPVLYLETKINTDQQYSHQPVFIWDICVHPDQPFICACVDSVGNFSIWDLRKHKFSQQLFTTNAGDFKADPIQHSLFTEKIHEGNVLHSRFITDQPNYIITCGEDGSVILLDLEPLELNPVFIEKLQSEKTVSAKKLLGRVSAISDFTIARNILLTANEDESISVKTLEI